MLLDRASRVVVVLMVGLTASAGFAAGEAEVSAARVTCRGYPATIVGTDGADRLVGTPRADVIVGRQGNDEILGRGGDDLICAGGGADLIRGGPGDDDIIGGPGDDRVGYETARRGVVVRLGAHRAIGQGRDRLIDVEGVQGSPYDDVVRGSAAGNLVYGKGGDDTLYGGAGDDFLVGGAGDDRLVDLRGSNTLLGYGGADVIVAAPREYDWLDGGRGRDRVVFRTHEGVSADLAAGRVSAPVRARIWAFEVIVGSIAGDNLQGSERGERLVGRGGGDILNGGDGQDVAVGGDGFDFCIAERERGCEL